MRVAILGAGISGLALGWYLKQRFGPTLSLSIYEKSHRPGGWIKSSRVDDFLFEEGPRSCRSYGAGIATLSLLESLNMESEVIVASPVARKRYLYHQGELCAVPGLSGLLFSPLTQGVVSALWKEWWQKPVIHEDESIYSFISRRFNPELAERLADPMTAGIYAGDIHRLSMRSCFPQVFQWEREYGSVIKGMFRDRKKKTDPLSPFVAKVKSEGSIFSLKQGMESLVANLAAQLKDELLLQTQVDAVEVKEEEIWVSSSIGGARRFDRIFCALPATEILRLFSSALKGTYDFSTTSVVTVGIAWKKPVLNKQGFGYLVASREKQDVLGVVFDSSVFPQQSNYSGETRLTAMLGGTHHPEIVQLSHEEIASRVRSVLCKHLSISCEPDAWHIKVAKDAIPQYGVGHLALAERVKKTIAQLSHHITLLGSAWHGVAVNDCIAEAARISASQ